MTENKTILDADDIRRPENEPEPIDMEKVRFKHHGQVYFDGVPVKSKTDNRPWYLK